MPDHLVSLATFSTSTEAGFLRSLLESEGISSYLADDATVSINPLLGNTIGWVKLLVAESDQDRAIGILEMRKAHAAELSEEELTAEALLEPQESFNSDGEDAFRAGPESNADYDPENPLEQLATRAFRASVIGFAFFPLLFYSAWLLARLVFSEGEWSPRTTRNAWMAGALLFAVVGAGWLLYEYKPVHTSDDFQNGHWRTEKAHVDGRLNRQRNGRRSD